MTPQRFKKVAFAALILLAVTVAFLALRPDAVPVDIAAVTQGDLVVSIEEEGETRVREVYVISAPVTGRLLRVPFDVGDPVTAGETELVRILPSDPAFLDARTEAERTAAVQSAQADVTRAKAEREFARTELDRTRTLTERGTLSQAALDRARMAFDTADAAVQAAQSNLTRARAALMEPDSRGEAAAIVTLKAPVSGRVLRLLQESESVVGAGQGLIEVGDPADLEIVADLLSADAVKVREGASVVITGWGGLDLDGRVRRVEPFGFTKVSALGVEEQRVNVIIDITSDAELWRAMGHGYRVDVAIEEWRGTDILKVPASALFRVGNDWAVFAYDDGVARQRMVSVGRFGVREAQVLDGLAAGEQVVLHPGASVEDGTRLDLRPPS